MSVARRGQAPQLGRLWPTIDAAAAGRWSRGRPADIANHCRNTLPRVVFGHAGQAVSWQLKV